VTDDGGGGQRTRVAAYAVATDDAGRILLCRTAPGVVAQQTWLLPGGGLVFGESPQAAVLRELGEEAGLEGEVERLLDVHDRLLDRQDDGERVRLHSIRIIYRVRVTGGELRDEPDGSTDTCAWFTPEEAAGLHLGDLAKRALRLLAGAEDPG
jgi:ADP-ribose pyrophosphatase YjhB (NUDIX family)